MSKIRFQLIKHQFVCLFGTAIQFPGAEQKYRPWFQRRLIHDSSARLKGKYKSQSGNSLWIACT